MIKYLAELVGTFMLVLVGAGSITIGLPHFWIAFSFGAIVTLMILCFGKISGAHINPVVSLGFYIKEKNRDYLIYVGFQLVGGLLAGWLLLVLFPESLTFGETMPSGSVLQTFIIEVLITLILMLSILWVIKTNSLVIIAIVVGFVVFLAAYFAGPYTGASMNPARTLGPNIVSGNIAIIWLYFVAPIIGALLASFLTKFIFKATK